MTMMIWRKEKNGLTFKGSSFIYPLGKNRARDFLLGMTGAMFDIDSIRKIIFNLDNSNDLSIIIRYSDERNEEHKVGKREQYKLYRIIIKETGI